MHFSALLVFDLANKNCNVSIILFTIIYIFFLDNTESPTNETIDAYIVNLDTLLTTGTGTDPSWITNVKRSISNLDYSVLK